MRSEKAKGACGESRRIELSLWVCPEKAIQEVGNLIKETKAGLLIVDVLQKFCRIKDLNDYAQVTNTLEPLMATARAENCHILLSIMLASPSVQMAMRY